MGEAGRRSVREVKSLQYGHKELKYPTTHWPTILETGQSKHTSPSSIYGKLSSYRVRGTDIEDVNGYGIKKSRNSVGLLINFRLESCVIKRGPSCPHTYVFDRAVPLMLQVCPPSHE